MKTEIVHFTSHGARLRGLLKTPDRTDGRPLPVVVQGPGWLGLAEGQLYQPWHDGIVAAGYAFLVFDYRGFGESEGEPGWILPESQIEDLRCAITFVETRPDLDADRIALFGMGGLGAANALVVAATDERVKAIAVQNVVADGRDWLRSMRREHEWVTFQQRVAENRRRMVRGEPGEMVDPREELMVATPERKAGAKKDVDAKLQPLFHLASAEQLLRARPLDLVDRIAPRALLVTSIEHDAVTPNHAALVYARAGAPKKHIHLKGTTHYGQYAQYLHVLLPQIVDWYDRYVRGFAVEIKEETLGHSRRELRDASGAVTSVEESR